MSFEIQTYGELDANTLLIQMVDDHDLKVIENEVAFIRKLSGEQSFCLKAVKVRSWNHDLSPWTAPAVFGNEDFGDGASKTLCFIKDEVLQHMADDDVGPFRKIYIGGYSLAGLFALWAGYQMDCFDGIAAVSPSIWFPDFTNYMMKNRLRADAVYLSLGDREERTKNPVMSQVGNAIRRSLNSETMCSKRPRIN